MNAQERDLLQLFLRQIQESRPAHKEPLAESMIQSALAANPDAAYVLVQRALGAELALKHQATSKDQPAASSPKAGGELRSILGNAAGVAAGVVAGGFIVEGIRSALEDTQTVEGLSEGLDGLGDLTDWV